jgi:hypothetical protein
MSEDLDKLLKHFCPNSLSTAYSNNRQLVVSMLQEALAATQFSQASFIKIRDALEPTEPLSYKQALENLLQNFDPIAEEKVLMNILQLSSYEMQHSDIRVTLDILMTHRYTIISHISRLVELPQATGTKFSLQICKLIELWVEHGIHYDRIRLANISLRIVRWFGTLDYHDKDLRAKLLCERLSGSLVVLCRDFECFGYVCTQLLSIILPFSHNALPGERKRNPTFAYIMMRELMKSPEEGEIEESGIKDRFNLLLNQIELYLRSPPHGLYSSEVPENPLDTISLVTKRYSECLPGLSNEYWDALFIRKQVLADSSTLKTICLLIGGGQRLFYRLLDLLLSILANLIGLWNKGKGDKENTILLIKIFYSVTFT